MKRALQPAPRPTDGEQARQAQHTRKLVALVLLSYLVAGAARCTLSPPSLGGARRPVLADDNKGSVK